MANEQNLIPIKELSTEEAKTRGSKGGKASVKARREKKAMRETLATLLTMPLKNGQVHQLDDVIALAELKGKNLTVQEAIVIKQVEKALKGDLRAAEFIRDTSGDKPVNTIEINKDIDESAAEIAEYINEYKKRDAGSDS